MMIQMTPTDHTSTVSVGVPPGICHARYAREGGRAKNHWLPT